MEFEEYIVDLNADCKCGCMECGSFHKIFKFPNMYGASVMNNPKKPGMNPDGYTIIVLKFFNDTDYERAVIPFVEIRCVCDSWEQTIESLQKIKGL